MRFGVDPGMRQTVTDMLNGVNIRYTVDPFSCMVGNRERESIGKRFLTYLIPGASLLATRGPKFVLSEPCLLRWLLASHKIHCVETCGNIPAKRAQIPAKPAQRAQIRSMQQLVFCKKPVFMTRAFLGGMSTFWIIGQRRQARAF